MQPSEPIRHTITEQRALVYKLLSDCYQSPDEHTIEKFQHSADLAADVFPEINQPENPNGQSENIETLKVDHARLFVGPFSLLAPPYGSMYLDHTEHLMTDSSMDVQQWYLAEGMDVAIHEVPDHIRIELEFMYYLIYKDLQKHTPDPVTEKILEMEPVDLSYIEKQQEFLQNHLGKWIPGFVKKVVEQSGTKFYKELAKLTAGFIKADIKFLQKQNDSK